MESNIYAEYSKIIADSEKWFRFARRDFKEQLNIDTLFESTNSKNFVKQMFFHENLVSIIPKLKFPAKRELHTVSAFLLGILLKDRLNLSTRSLPDPCKDRKKSFIYFWSMICLAHDLTFWIETNEEYLKNCVTIEDFCEEFNIKYRLIDKTKYANLFKNYYKYSIQKRKVVDHGITCGILMYDQLMKQYERNSNKQNVITNDPWKYNKNFKDYALKISETIARHNLWVASPQDEDTYREYDLYDLISNEQQFKKVNYSEQDSLLFLLGLVDTLEPIKCCTRNKTKYDAYEILKNINVSWNSRSKNLSISSKYITSDILQSWNNLQQWLNLNVGIIDNTVKITFEYESADNNQLVA